MEITPAAAETNEDLRFPLGRFDKNAEVTAELRERFIQAIGELPAKLAAAVDNLSDEQLETPYRPGGWTLRQTVHHVADSHLNSLCRFKLALTEDNPTIRPYEEQLWAELADSRLPVAVSLDLLRSVHTRWTTLLESMSEADFQKPLVHPASGGWTLDQMLALYEWHSRHHTAHITRTRERHNW
jgi:uncharacterized damage-inducible protein DinB